MNKQHVFAATTIAALAFLSAGAARADDTSRPLTREEVVAQTLAARQSGELAVLSTGGVWSAPAPESKLTRDEVAAQVMAARESGELAAISTGSEWVAPKPAPVAEVRRDDVIKEFLATRHPSDAMEIERSI